MPKSTRRFRCGKCKMGIVNVHTTETKSTISVSYGSCNECGFSYGVKSAENLIELPKEEVTVRKLELDDLNILAHKHIYQLNEAELKSMAFILDVEISDFSKSSAEIKFKIKSGISVAYVECGHNGNISMGKSNKVRNGLSGLTSWGGVFSFIEMMVVFRCFIAKSLEVTLQSPEKLKIYPKGEWKDIFSYLFDRVFSNS